MKFFSKSILTFPMGQFPINEIPAVSLDTKPVNKQGYRCREFSDLGDKNIIFIGDEWTEGVGVSYPNTYSAIVTKKFSNLTGYSFHEFNFGHRNKSFDYITRIIWCALNVLKPDFVFMCFPKLDRREYFALDGRLIDYDSDQARKIANGEFSVNRIDQELTTHLHELLSDFDHSVNALKNFHLLECLLDDRDIPWAYSFNQNAITNEHTKALAESGLFDKHRYIGSSFNLIDRRCPRGEYPDDACHRLFGEKVFTWINEKYPELTTE